MSGPHSCPVEAAASARGVSSRAMTDSAGASDLLERWLRGRTPPEKLYKFKGALSETGGHPNPIARGRLERVLLADLHYTPTPAELNDEFDCRPVVVNSLDPGEVRRRLVARVAFRFAHDNLAERVTRSMRAEAKMSTVGALWCDWAQRHRVYCLTADGESPAMWAHYGNDHRGLCLVYELRPGPREYDLWPGPVEYREQRPVFEAVELAVGGEAMERMFVEGFHVKAMDWAFEKEWRLLRKSSEPELAIRPEFLTGVVLGAKMPPADRAFVISLLRRRRLPMRVYEARPDERGYRMTPVPIVP